MPRQRPVFSFDVFDTCLLRLCGDSKNLFEVLSKKVLDLMCLGNDGEQLRKLFVWLRSKTGGMSLYDIYTQINKEFRLPCSIEKMVLLELQTEAEMLRPIEKTLRLVEGLRKRGDVIFISDMYLPDGFIREQLTVTGFFHEGDRLYVSNTVGAWKYDGSLFKLIHERDGIDYRHWHHYGDSRHSDVKIPQKLGIDAHWLHFDYLPYEQKWINDILTTGYQYPSILAGVSRAIRLTSTTSQCQVDFVSNISAPVMTTWVYGVLCDAYKSGIRRIFFLARDTHSYLVIARELQSLFPDIELKYLFVSRQSLYNDNPLRIKYFEQEGLASHDHVAVVDIATTGKTLCVINQVLSQNGYSPINKFYCFFGLNMQGVTTEMDEDMDQMMAENKSITYCAFKQYLSAVENRLLNRLTNHVVFVEALFSLNYHGRTVDYCQHGDKIRPVLEPDSETPWSFCERDERNMKKNNDSLLKYYINAMQTTLLTDYSQQILERIAVPTLANFFNNPRKVYLEYVRLFQLVGVSYVDRRWKKNIWKRGSTVYTFPEFWVKLLDKLKRRHSDV
ncbi:MAG: hypothetical protein IKM85_05410 [Bacteroidales bacterium]|nr:hypothetical protein [Bacteroidales bacterium]